MLRQYQRANGGSYRTLDNRQDQEAALADPVAFAVDGESPRLIDEVHLGGDWLVRAIKIAVDEDPRPGRFILSGSSRFLTIPTLSESLAGRAGFVDLWPLSMAEVTGGSADFLSRVFREPTSLQGTESFLDAGRVHPGDLPRGLPRGTWPAVASGPECLVRRLSHHRHQPRHQRLRRDREDPRNTEVARPGRGARGVADGDRRPRPVGRSRPRHRA